MSTAQQGAEVKLVNPFVLTAKDYKRDIDVLRHYLDQGAHYLSIMTGKPYLECFNWIKVQMRPGGKFPFKDPAIEYLERGDNGDREKKSGTMYNYIMTSVKERDIIAPTFTTYLHPTKKRSLFAVYIANGKKRRNIAKKEMYKAEMDGNKVVYAFKKLEQTNFKQKNNSLSGAHNSTSTPLWNKTAHSTLTTICRATSGYGNANNEKFLAGNRHYWAPFIATNNIVSIVTHTDYDRLQKTVDAYQLHLPTADEMLSVIDYSVKHYWGPHWKNSAAYGKLLELAQKLTPLNRAAFVYTGDLYHLRRFNPEVVRALVMGMSQRVDVVHPDPESIFSNCFEDQRNLAMQLCPHVSKGFSADDLRKGGKDDKGVWIPAPENAAAIVASTIVNIYETVNKYADFIQTFFVTDNVPASMAYFPESIRHTALMSDTDSTIFTAQEWVEWQYGVIGFTDEMKNLSATMIALASSSITHVLAKMSANLGGEEDKTFSIKMKNEFKFEIFVPTNVAKHYYAYISSSEGNVYAKMKEEIKGVHLKNSNVSRWVMGQAKELMVNTMKTIMAGNLVDLRGELLKIAQVERDIFESIKGGSHDFFRYGRINSPDAYKRKEGETDLMHQSRSNYRNYLLWEEVFAPDYGSIPPPPYTCLKMTMEINTPTKMALWLDSMKNQALADRMRMWLTKYNKKYVGSVWLPEQLVQTRGIPVELLEVVDVRKMIIDCTAVFYKIMESFGIYMIDDKRNKMFMDYY